MSELIEIHERLDAPATAEAELVLPFETRQRSRFRAELDNGVAVGVFLPRGTVLRGGDLLRSADGRVVRVRAAAESVSTAHGEDPLLLARAAYHLGNRHVPLQIGPDWLRYLHDHVLDDMVRGLGLSVTAEQAPLEPEAGAYGGHRSHGHAHGHTHEH